MHCMIAASREMSDEPKIWAIKVYTSRQLTKDQYSEGVFLLKPRPKQDSDENFEKSKRLKRLKQLEQLKRRQSSPTK